MQFAGRQFAAPATPVPAKPCYSNIVKVSKSESLKVLRTHF